MSTLNDLDTMTSSGSKIRFKVVRNAAASHITGEEVNTARVLAHKTYSLKDMAGELVNRKIPCSRSLVNYILSELSDLMQDLLIQGNTVNLGGLVRLTPTIKGRFDDGEEFNKDKHTLAVSASPGKVLRYATAEATVERITGTAFPEIKQLFNATDGAADCIYSQGSAVIIGKHLSFDADAEDEGLFVEKDGMETKCDIASASNGRIYFTVKNTFTVDGEEATLILKTRQGDVTRTTPIRVNIPFTTRIEQ